MPWRVHKFLAYRTNISEALKKARNVEEVEKAVIKTKKGAAWENLIEILVNFEDAHMEAYKSFINMIKEFLRVTV